VAEGQIVADETNLDAAELLRRVETIEKRLQYLELALQKPPASSQPSTPFRPPAEPPGQKPRAEIPKGAILEPASGPQTAGGPREPISPMGDEARLAPARPAPIPFWPQVHPDFEQMMGLKWSGWVGAIVFAIGAGLGIKFAYDQGWFGNLPVAVRLSLMSLVGFALLAAGEVVYRRVNVVSAAALFGAGVAVLFLVSYAGNVYYGAYNYETAFVFALLTTLLGSAVAMRGRLVAVALLSQIGGQLAPVLLNSGQPPGLALLAYVFMLQIVATTLVLWGRTDKWWILRVFSLAATSWWVAVALIDGHWEKGLANQVLWFAVVYAAVYQGELLRSALVAQPGEGGPIDRLRQGWGTVYSLLVTAGLTAVLLWIFYDYDSRVLRGGSTLVLAGLCLAGGLGLRSEGNPLVSGLATGYRIQALALLMLFVPVTFTGTWICLAWGVLSLALAAPAS
jgi:uncharacterized membrane protein